MKYNFQIQMGKTVTKTVPHNGKMDVTKMKKILDDLYFNNLPDRYPAATATVTSSSPPSKFSFSRPEGSNAAGMWT